MAIDIFKNPTKTIPQSDQQIVRVDMIEQQIGGRKSALPKPETNDLVIRHVPNEGK